MAFIIKNIKDSDAMKIFQAILKVEAKSRFIFEMETEDNFKRVNIGKIRLRQAKDYCGNHPLPCPVRAVHVPHKVMTLLEGADWVAFNDMLNDVLDKMKVSADVASSLVIIRKGEKRCVEYTSHLLNNNVDNEWDKDSGFFESRMGVVSPRSDYPNGTPGIPEYLTSKAKGYQIPDHDHH